MSGLSIKQYVFRKGAAKGIPVSGTFELTSRCNLSCKMCYVHMSPDEQSNMGRELTTEEWIALGKDAVEEGMIYLLLTGGEPLLRPDFLEIYTSLIQMGVMVSVNTNGTLLTPEHVACFKKYKPEKINISLYGMSDDTYGRLCGNSQGFKKAIQGIRMLKEAGIRVNLNTTFTKYNINDMEAIVAFAKEEQIPVRMSAYIFPPVRNQHCADSGNLTPEELGAAAARFDLLTMEEEQLEKRKNYVLKCMNCEPDKSEMPESKNSSCMAGRGAFWISWDGKLYPCGMLSDYEQDIRKEQFVDAWHQTCECMKTIFLPAECSVCRYEPLCPVCAAVSGSVNKATDKVPEEMCVRTKAYVKNFLNCN